MAYKVFEIGLKARGINAADDSPALAQSATDSTITIDTVVVNGVEKSAANFFAAAELATLTAALKAGLVNLLDVNTISAATITKGAGVGGGTGQFTVTGVSCSANTVAEVWTITATSATNWTVTGATSGASSPATTGVPYDNGQIAFTINDTGTDAAATDAFTLTVTQV